MSDNNDTTVQHSATKITKSAGGIVLPQQQNDASVVIAKEIERILPALAPGVERQQFAVSLVVAANELSMDKVGKVHSILIAAFNAARIGLPVGGAQGLAFFVPRKGRVCLDVGYRGYIELAVDSGHIDTVATDVYLAGEAFEQWTDEDGKHFRHVPHLPDQRDLKWENVLGAYVVYKTRAGGKGCWYSSSLTISNVLSILPPGTL